MTSNIHSSPIGDRLRTTYLDNDGITRSVIYDAVMTELIVDGKLYLLLNLNRIAQSDHILTMTYADDSTRVILTANAVEASRLRVFIYLAVQAFSLENLTDQYPALGVLKPNNLNPDVTVVYFIRAPAAGHCDAVPRYTHRCIVVLQNTGARMEYNPAFENDRRRFLTLHYKD
jgi:hypothetical protein